MPQDVTFDVFDFTKGSNKAWFQYGFYPAKAVSDLDEDAQEEFQVRIETDGRRGNYAFGKENVSSKELRIYLKEK